MRIQEFLAKRRITQASMAKAIGVSIGNLSNIATGKRGAAPETIVKIVSFSANGSGVPMVTADDIIATWAEANGLRFPLSSKAANGGSSWHRNGKHRSAAHRGGARRKRKKSK